MISPKYVAAISESGSGFLKTNQSPAEMTGSNLTEDPGNSFLKMVGVQGPAARTSLSHSRIEAFSLSPMAFIESISSVFNRLAETACVFSRNSTP